MASLDLVRGCRRTDSPASTTRRPRPYSARRLRSFSDLTRQRERGARQCSTARPTADRRTAARSTSHRQRHLGDRARPPRLGGHRRQPRREGPAARPRAHQRGGRQEAALARRRHAAARGRGRLRLPAAARHRNFHLAHRDDGLAGELGGNALFRFGLTDPGRVAVQHAAAVVVPVGGKVHVGISIVMAPGSANRASRTSSEAPASPRTVSTIWQSSLRRCAASYEADHIARHPRAVRAWDRRCGRMVS
jgi:hypothetical protein